MKILLGSIYPFAFALLLLIVPFDDYVRALPNILLIILAITYPFIIKKEHFKRIDKRAGILLLSLVLMLLISTLITSNWEANLAVLEKVGIAIVVLLLYLPISSDGKIKNAIIFSSLAAILYSAINIFGLVKNTGTFDFGNTSNPLHALLIDRLYLGLLSILSILVSYNSFTKKYSSYNKYYLANIVINIIFLFLIVARMAILTLVIIAVLRLFYQLRNRKIILVTFAAIAVIVLLAFKLNDNLATRFFYLTYGEAGQSVVQRALKQEPRTIIWTCALNMAKKGDHIIFGRGFSVTESELVDCYGTNIIKNKERQKWFLERKYNSHNQFVDIYLSAGILCLFFIAILFIYLFVKNRKSYFLTALLITIFCFGFIENFLHRQIGGYYFGVILIFLLLAEFKESANKDQVEINSLKDVVE